MTKARSRLLIVTAALLIVSAISIVFAGLRIVNMRPTLARDFGAELHTLSRESQPDGDNGWNHLLSACAIMDEVRDELFERSRREVDAAALSYRAVIDVEPTEAEADTVRRSLQMLEQRGLFGALQSFAACSRFVRPAAYSAASPLVDQVAVGDGDSARSISLALCIDMRWAFERGDCARSQRNFEIVTKLAEAFELQPTALEQLTSIAMLRTAVEEVRRAAAGRLLDEQCLSAFEDLLQGISLAASIDRALQGERLLMLDMIQRLHTDDGSGDGTLIMSELSRIVADGTDAAAPGYFINVRGLTMPSRKQTESLLMTEVARISSVSNSGPSDAALQRLSSPNESELRENPVAAFLLPKLEALIFNRNRLESAVRSTRLLLAIEHHRLRTGSYPPDLTVFAPELLTVVRDDPISGMPFVYRSLDNGDEFLLYSVGINQIDDGGKYLRNNAFIAVESGMEYDFVVNRPRPELEE